MTSHDEVRALLRAEVLKRGSLRKVAKEIGCSGAWLHQVLMKGAAPGPKVLRYFGLHRVETYAPLPRRKKS